MGTEDLGVGNGKELFALSNVETCNFTERLASVWGPGTLRHTCTSTSVPVSQICKLNLPVGAAALTAAEPLDERIRCSLKSIRIL